MKTKQLSTTLMPFAFYGMAIIWLVSFGVLLWSLLTHPHGFVFIALLVYSLFGLYIYFSFQRYKTIKCDGSKYYLTNMFNDETKVVELEQLETIRPIKYIGVLTPWTKVFVYKDKAGKRRKALFVEKVGLS